MPKRKTGENFIRRYKSYSTKNLLKAIQQIRKGKISINRASVEFGIAKGTLMNKIKNKHTSKVGRPLVLQKNEEDSIVHHMITVSEFTRTDLCQLVKIYLDKSKRTEPQFKQNCPSLEWAQRFIVRHKQELTERVCQNIKLSRAGLTVEGMNVYFDNLTASLTLPDGSIIPPERIFNYDETNLSDDPGAKRCIFKRGVKYPERVRDSSKACTSLMFCGSATGQMLPPYVVYKAINLYDTWMVGGPANTRYFLLYIKSNIFISNPYSLFRFNRSKSGWFDSVIFTDWVTNMFIPFIKKKKLNTGDNKVVLIGDNLSSHFTEEVLAACKDNNVLFICIPTNSTHLTQPLDGPLKRYWRAILNKIKQKISNNYEGMFSFFT